MEEFQIKWEKLIENKIVEEIGKEFKVIGIRHIVAYVIKRHAELSKNLKA